MMLYNVSNFFVTFSNFIRMGGWVYISYIVAVSFIGEGNRSTRREPPTCRKSLTNFIT